MPIDNKTITFATNLLPNSDLGYNLGVSDQRWNIFGNVTGNADTATVATKLTTANLGSETKPIYLLSGVATECDTYAGGTAVTLNNTPKGAQAASFYAPTAPGNAGQVLISNKEESNNNNTPGWYTGLTLLGTGQSGSSYSATFEGALTVEGMTTLSSTLSVTGAATLSNTLQVAGNVGIGVAPQSGNDSNKLYVNGNSEFNGNIIPTVSVSSAPAFTLGSSDNRWAGVYIGTSPTYGNAYTPIYWNNGVPTEVTLVQQFAFTINSGKSGVRLTHTAITIDSYVTQIVVTDGESNLNSAISWQSYNGANTGDPGYIELTCSAVSGDVIGYIIISRGGEIITATAADIT